jgi:hypothetical protein
MGKGPNGSDEFDFDSRGEGKGKGTGTKKSREVIKLEAVFHSGPRVRIATYVAILVCQPISLFRAVELPSSCAPGIRPSPSPDPSLDRIRSLIPPPVPLPGTWPRINCRPFTRPLSVTWNRFPLGQIKESITCSVTQSQSLPTNRHSAFFFVHMVRTRCPSTLATPHTHFPFIRTRKPFSSAQLSN